MRLTDAAIGSAFQYQQRAAERQRVGLRKFPDLDRMSEEAVAGLMEKLGTSTEAFTRQFWSVVEPERAYVPGWHVGCVAAHLDEVARPGTSMRNLIINVPPRCMKLCADDTDVYTPNGWRKHGDLRVGDEVFSPDGTATKVIAVHPKDVADRVVTLSNGEAIHVNGEHLWTVYSRSMRKWVTYTTDHLHRLALISGGRCVFQLPDVRPLQFAERSDLPLHPYFVGCWLGDGTSTKPVITHSRDETAHLEAIRERCGLSVTARYEHPDPNSKTVASEFRHQGVIETLRRAGLYDNKHIPGAYLRSSVEQRMQLLAGLIDTDGWTDEAGRVQIATSSARLRDDVFELCQTLGLRPYVTEVETPAWGKYDAKRPHWRVGFQATGPIPCAIDRKSPKRFAAHRAVGIASVTAAAVPKRGNCITVDREDGLYLVGRTLQPTHNSLLTCVFWFARVWTARPGTRWMFASFGSDLVQRDSQRCREIVGHPFYQRLWPVRIKPAQDTQLRFTNTHEGYRYAVTVQGQGMGEGADFLCHPAGTLITTARGRVPVEDVTVSDQVLAFDHAQGVTCWRPVTHAFTRSGEGADSDLYGRRDLLYRVRTRSGRELTLTGNHPVWVNGRGYVPAAEVCAGDEVTCLADADVRLLPAGVPDAHSALQAQAAQVPLLRPRVPGRVERGRTEPGEPGAHGDVRDVLRHLPLADAIRGSCGDDLFPGVPEQDVVGGAHAANQRPVHELRPTSVVASESGTGRAQGVLLTEVCRSAAPGSDPWAEERAVPFGGFRDPLSGGVLRISEAPSSGARRVLRSVPDEPGGTPGATRGGLERSPHRLGRDEQRPGESGFGVQGMSREDARIGSEPRRVGDAAPCVLADAVESVTLLGERGTVYSIEVAEHHNYFAAGVLVHNCIDDPQNPKRAASAVERENTIFWYKSTFARRANDEATACKVLIMQRLNERDLTGYLRAEQSGWDHLVLPMRYEPRRFLFGADVGGELSRRHLPAGAPAKAQTVEAPAGPEYERLMNLFRGMAPAEPEDAPDPEGAPKASADPEPVPDAEPAKPPRDAISRTGLQEREPKWRDGPEGSGRENEGDLLWPARFPEHLVAAAEAELGTEQPGQYQQRPTGESGDIFEKDSFRTFRPAYEQYDTGSFLARLHLSGPDPAQVRDFGAGQLLWFQTIDTALTDKRRSAYTACLTFGITPEFDLILWNVFRAKLNVQYQYPAIKLLRSGPVHWDRKRRALTPTGQWPFRIEIQAVEEKASGFGILQQAASEGNPLHPLKAEKDKVARAAPVAGMYRIGKVYHPERRVGWVVDAEDELLKFPSGQYADIVDCVAHAGQLVIHDKLIRSMCANRIMAHVGDDEGHEGATRVRTASGEHVIDWPDDPTAGRKGDVLGPYRSIIEGMFRGDD